MDQARRAFLLGDFRQAFTAHLGFEAIEAAEGHFASAVALTPALLQQDGLAHAGVVATLADHTAGYAAYTLVGPESRILTVEFKINFLKPAAGVALHCQAQVISRGRTILPAESAVWAVSADGGRKLAAKAMVTLMVVPAAALRRES